MIAREPSCVLNHEMMRRNLRDFGQESLECPDCHWMLYPAKKEEICWNLTQQEETAIRELIRQVLVENRLIDAAAEDE